MAAGGHGGGNAAKQLDLLDRPCDDTEQALDVACVRELVHPSEASAALGRGGWDLVVCSVPAKNSDMLSGVLEVLAAAREAFLPSIVIADAFEDIAVAAYAARAAVCVRARLSEQLPSALRTLLVERDLRRQERRTRAFERGQREILEHVAAGAPVRDAIESSVSSSATVSAIALSHNSIRASAGTTYLITSGLMSDG